MHRKSAFTLIEILVVVAIIALLVAILMPSLGRAREQARRALCAANTRQMSVAMYMYASEYGYYTGHHYDYLNSWEPLNPGFSLDEYCEDLAAELGMSKGDCMSQRNGDILWPARLLKFLKGQNEVFWCPSSRPDMKWNGTDHIVSHPFWADQDDEQGTFAYAINDWGQQGEPSAYGNLGLGAWIQAQVNHEAKLEWIKRPAEMIAIADSNGDFEWETSMSPKEPGQWPGKRHDKGANVAFCDGHTDWMRQEMLIHDPDDDNPISAAKLRLWNRDNKVRDIDVN